MGTGAGKEGAAALTEATGDQQGDLQSKMQPGQQQQEQWMVRRSTLPMVLMGSTNGVHHSWSIQLSAVPTEQEQQRLQQHWWRFEGGAPVNS